MVVEGVVVVVAVDEALKMVVMMEIIIEREINKVVL